MTHLLSAIADPTCVIDGRRPVEDGRVRVCWPCEQRMGRQLDYLAAAAPLLWVIAHNEPNAAGELNLHALDLAQHAQTQPVADDHGDQVGTPSIASVLGSWVEAWSGRDVMSANANSCARWLRGHLERACEALDTAIEEFAAELRTLYATARRALNRDWTGQVFATPCPNCGGKTLVRTPGADWIECGPCEWLWDEEEYAQLAIRTLRATFKPAALLTAWEIATTFEVDIRRVRTWKSRGKIHVQPGPWGGLALIPRGEVEQILQAQQVERERRAELRERDRTGVLLRA